MTFLELAPPKWLEAIKISSQTKCSDRQLAGLDRCGDLRAGRRVARSDISRHPAAEAPAGLAEGQATLEKGAGRRIGKALGSGF